MSVWGHIHDGILVQMRRFDGPTLPPHMDGQNWVNMTGGAESALPGTPVNDAGNVIPIAVTDTRRRAAMINGLAMSHETSGVWFEPSGADEPMLFSSGRDSLVMLLLFDHAEVSEVLWRDAHGNDVALSGSDVAALLKQIGQFVAAVRAHAAELRTGDADPADGWPDNGKPSDVDEPVATPSPDSLGAVTMVEPAAPLVDPNEPPNVPHEPPHEPHD